MYLVVAYDIKDDKRRRKLYQALKGFGTPTQFSLFECNLSLSQKKQLEKLLIRYIKEEDRVSMYTLCAGCARRIEWFSTIPRVEPVGEDQVIRGV